MDRTTLQNVVPCSVRDTYALAQTASENLVNEFVNSYEHIELEGNDKCVTHLLSEVYGSATARAMKFLLDQVDYDARLRFAYTYLAPEALANHVTTCIVVKPVLLEERTSLTIGRYAVFLRTDNRDYDMLVRFPTQVATVYYLLHLIDRAKYAGWLPPFDSYNNGRSFCEVYRMVYPISIEEAGRRYRQLLYRIADGKVRAGRKGQTISEVRNSLERAFLQTSDSYVPYAMTARSHLAVPPHRIIFEDIAQELLQVNITHKTFVCHGLDR